ncbi:MAG: hypothetical protein O3B13_11060, partial [Planctomycetota bacterium]|nr:hypothetical protein [Planctomycetota bacterium]
NRGTNELVSIQTAVAASEQVLLFSKHEGARNNSIFVSYSVHQDHPETNHRQELSSELQIAHIL